MASSSNTNHLEILRLVRRLGLELEDVRNGWGAPRGRRLPRRRRHPYGLVVATKPVRREIDRFWQEIAELAAPLDPADPVAAGERLDARSVADFLDDIELEETARFFVEQQAVVGEYTVEPTDLSLLFFAALEKLYEDVPESGIEAFRIRGGNDRLPQRLAMSLRSDVILGSAVTAVDRSSHGVTVAVAIRGSTPTTAYWQRRSRRFALSRSSRRFPTSLAPRSPVSSTELL